VYVKVATKGLPLLNITWFGSLCHAQCQEHTVKLMTEQHQAQIAQLKKDMEADKQIALGLQNTQLVRWQQVGCE
jgi:hypothetical protein